MNAAISELRALCPSRCQRAFKTELRQLEQCVARRKILLGDLKVSYEYWFMFYSPNVNRNGTPLVRKQYSFMFYSLNATRNGKPIVGMQYSFTFYSPNVIRNDTPLVGMQYLYVFYSLRVTRNGNTSRRNAIFVYVLQPT